MLDPEQQWKRWWALLIKLRDKSGLKEFLDKLELHPELRQVLHSIPYWAAALAAGLIAVVYSSIFGLAITLGQELAVSHRWIYLAAAPVLFAFATYVVKRFAPAAGGTGVPQVNRALQLDYPASEKEIDRLLGPNVLVVIVLSSVAVVFAGGALGREGPVVQISACLFYFVGKQFSKFVPFYEHRSWITAGGAAGIAAAFNAPLAGIVFVVEELAQLHFHQFKTVILSAVILAGMLAQWLSGRYLFLGFPRIDSASLSVVPITLLVGIACGLLAGIFLRCVNFAREASFSVRKVNPVAFAALMGLIVASLAVFLDKRTIGGGTEIIQDLLFHDEKASFRLMVARFFSTIFAHISGCAGGFLAPALSMGALVGSKIAVLLSPANHNLLVMTGMSAFLSAVFRAPFTALVIVIEMTDRHSAIFQLMIAAVVAAGVVRLVRPNA